MKVDRNKLNNFKKKSKKKLIGSNGDGVLHYILVYTLLISVGFVFLYPIFYMISYSLKGVDDLVNPLVNWIPTKFYLGNYKQALTVLDFKNTLLQTIYVSILPAIIQSIAASLIGYGFARFEFKGKKILFFLVIATFVIPPQITMIPQFLMFKKIGLLGNILVYILPALFGQGIRSAIFILIFYQFFRMIPKSLEEAAEVDGAGSIKIFFKIAIPIALPAYIISFLFSFVWYWNETYLASMYFGDAIQTLPLQLQKFSAAFAKMFPGGATESGLSVNESIKMAGTFLNIVPLLIVYFITQRWFVEGVDRSGITGE